jgi:hypothetical protein
MNTYVLFGRRFDYDMVNTVLGEDKVHDLLDPYRDDPRKPEFNPMNGVTVLYDGMNGEYVYVGCVIAKSPEGQGFEDPVEIPVVTTEMNSAVYAAINSLGLVPLLPPGDVGFAWHVVSHYR